MNMLDPPYSMGWTLIPVRALSKTSNQAKGCDEKLDQGITFYNSRLGFKFYCFNFPTICKVDIRKAVNARDRYDTGLTPLANIKSGPNKIE